MKRTQLLFIMLLTLATSVWAADIPSSLAFRCSQKGNGTLLDGGSSDKCITDGLFEWSAKGEDELKWNGEWVILKTTNPVKGRTRSQYHFQAGTYRFTFHFKTNGEQNIQYYDPQVSLNDGGNYYPASPASHTSTDDNKNGGTFSVDVPVASEGDYKVRVQFRTDNNGEKVQYSTVDIALQGGGGQGQGGEQGGGGQGQGGGGQQGCTNTMTILCYQNRIVPTGGTSAPSNLDDQHDPYYGSATKYADFNGSEGEIYYAVSLPAGTYSIKVWSCNGNDRYMNIYQKGYGSDIYYDGSSYGKLSGDQGYIRLWPEYQKTMVSGGWDSKTLGAGDYIIGLYGKGWAAFEKVVFTATGNVFCPPASTYTITYNPGVHGTGSIAAGEKTEGEDFTLSSETFSRNGYRQTGWATTDGGAKAYDLGDTYTEDADLILYPYWEENLSTTWTLYGDWDSWNTESNPFIKHAGESTGNVAYCTIDLTAGDHQFKVRNSNPGSDAYACGAIYTYQNTVNDGTIVLRSSEGANCHINAKVAGEYTFKIDFSSYNAPIVDVEYPAFHTVTFDKNDNEATGSMSEAYVNQGANYQLASQGFSKSHWHFLGWATSAEGEVVYADAATIENIREDINLYAKWAIDRFDVVYDGNGVDGYKGELPATVTYDYDTEVAISDVVLEKFGYTFVGWNTNKEASTAESGTFHVTANKTFYAIWQVTKPTSISIRPEDNNYTPVKGTSVQMIATLTPDANTMAIENRELTWSSKDATVAFVDQNGFVSFVGSDPDNATWIRATSKVDGSVYGEYNFYVKNGNCDGLKIHSWDGNGQRDDYFRKVGEHEWRCTYVLPNVTKQFWVGECGNGSWDGYQNDHSQTKSFGDGIRLADCRGHNNYPGQDAVGELIIYDDSGDKNYYIGFLPNYRMSYMVSGSQWRIMNFHHTQYHEYETDIFRVPVGYKDNASMKCYVGIQKSNGDNMEVPYKSAQVAMNTIGGLSGSNMAGKYGKWHIYSDSGERNWYCQFIYYNNVTFEMNGGAGNIDPIYGKNGAGETFNTGDLTNPTRTGYTLTGWKDQNKVTYGLSQNITISSDLVLTAQWAPATYTITLDKNNGSANGQATATYDNNELASVTHVTRTGYDLTGYFTEAAAGTMVITAEGALLPSVANYTDESGRWIKPADATLYAQWQAKQYTVTLDNQSATTAGQTEVTATYDAAMPSIAGSVPAKTGYTFGGYYDAENGAGTQYYTNEGASAHVWDKTSATTLYAKWTADTYTITYELNGGVNSGSNPENYTIETATFALLAPTRDNYTFAGWYTEEGFTNVINSIVLGTTGDLHLYAKWTATEFTITYNLDGGTNHGSNPATYTVESAAIMLQDPTKDGFDFVGWYTEEGFVNQVTSIAAGSTGAKTFYAKWAENPCTNTLTIQCESGMLIPSSATYGMPQHYIVGDDSGYWGETFDGKYIEFKDNSGGYSGSIYYSFTLPQATTVSFDVYTSTNKDNQRLRLFGKEGGEFNQSDYVTIDGTTYKKYNRSAPSAGKSENQQFGQVSVEGSYDLPAGTYIIGLYGGQWATWDKVVVKATTPVFCPSTVTFSQPEHGSVTAAVVGGEAIATGAEVEAGAQVVFTYAPADNYEFVNFSDGMNTYTQNPCTLTVNGNMTITTTIAAWEEVHNLIATGTSANIGLQQDNGESGAITVTSVEDPLFDHNVLSLAYNMPNSGSYCGYSLPTDGGYAVNAKATGFAFWYKAEDNVYMEIKADGNSKVFKLSATDGAWRYVYLEDAAAKTATSFEFWVNYSKDGWSMTKTSGTLYLSEIQATNVTSMPEKRPQIYTITLDKNGGQANGSATATLHSNTLTGVTRVTRTGHTLTGYFTEDAAGTMVITADGTLVANVDGYTDGSANWTKEEATTLYAQWQVKVTHVTANANGGAYAGGTCNGDFPYGCTATVECFPTKTDYNFLGYTLTQDDEDYIFNATGNMVDYAGYVAEGRWVFEGAELTIYAKWISATTYYDISVAADPADKGTVTMTVGSEDPTSDLVHVIAGTEITLNANCTDPTFAFKQWQDGNRDKQRTIIASETMTYTATFETYYTINATMGVPGDRIEGADQPHFGGDQVTLTAVARTQDSGGNDYDLTYGLKNWSNVNGVSLNAEQQTQNPLTFTMPYQNVSLRANFSPIECTNTKTIQCEDESAYIFPSDTKLTQKPKPIPNSGGCTKEKQPYTLYNGDGYYAYREASDCEMYYPIHLPAGTYNFTVWAVSNGDKECYMNVYTLGGTQGDDVTYNGTTYHKESYVKVGNIAGSNTAPFAEAGTISNITLNTDQTVFVGLYATYTYANFDQIVITADGDVFCEPISTEQFVINARETKEVPVCGVANLTIYEGGEANNYDDFNVTESVKYIYTVAESDIDKWLTLCTPYQTNAITVVNDPDNPNGFIWPLWMNAHNQLQAGYFYIKELGNRNETAMGEEFKQRWDVIKTQYPQDDMAYIVKYPYETFDGYFAGKQMSYNRTGAATIYGIKNATSALAAERIVSEPRFYYYPNHSMSTLQYEGDVYMLNEAGTNFDLQTNPYIKPFTCYIQATEEYKAKHRSLRMTDVLQGEANSDITSGLENTDWTMESLLADPDTRVFDMVGHYLGHVDTNLPTGVYVLVNGQTNVKYIVK